MRRFPLEIQLKRIPSRRIFTPTWLALLLSAPSVLAAPRCELSGAAWIEGRRVGSRSPAARRVDLRSGETLQAFVAAPGKLNGRRVVFGDAGGPHRISWRGAGCPDVRIAWFTVEPRMQHENTPAPNKELSVFANAQVFGPHHGRWIGYDKLEYFESPLPRHTGWTTPFTGATPTEPRARLRAPSLLPLGVMRLKATLQLGRRAIATPGARDAPSGLISDRVFRYTFRRDDTFLGWLTSYFNVPYLFGSAGKGARNQAERYLGADCADILVAALRRSGRRSLAYSSVGELVNSLRKVSGPVEIRPCDDTPACAPPSSRLRFGSDVRPGDLLAMNYLGASELPRAWDHIVAIVEDRGPEGHPADGWLGPEDLAAETGSADGLKFSPLSSQGAIRVIVLRP